MRRIVSVGSRTVKWFLVRTQLSILDVGLRIGAVRYDDSSYIAASGTYNVDIQLFEP